MRQAKTVTRRQLIGWGVRVGAGVGLTGSVMSRFPASRAFAAAKEVRLGAVLALTGSNSGWGQRTWRGFQTAIQIINQGGGIRALGGATLVAKSYDTQSQPDVAGTQAERAIRDGAVVLVGTNQSPATLVASQICERETVPFVTSSDFDPKLTSRGFKYMFQTDPFLVDHVRDMLGFCQSMGKKTGSMPKRLGLLCDNTVVGQSAQKAFAEQASGFGFQVAVSDSYSLSVTDFSSYIAKMKSADVDLLLGFQTPQPAVLIVRAMKQQHFMPIAFGGILGGQVSNDYLNGLGADADYTLCSSPWNTDLKIPGMDKLMAVYKQQWNETMDDTVTAGFSSAAVIWEALERSGSADPKKLRDAIAAVDLEAGQRNYIDLAGCKFDEHGYNVKAAVDIKQIKDKGWHSVWPEKYASGFQVVWPQPGRS